MVAFMVMKVLRISDGGQVSVPAAVRKRWKTRRLIAEDEGDRLVLRPLVDDPIRQALGVFADHSGPDSEEMRRLDRLEEAEIEARKDRQLSGDSSASR